MKKVYLDYAATTPVDQRVWRAMTVAHLQQFGNPASLHAWGREAQNLVDQARWRTARFLTAGSEQIIFTSGATESNNLAIRGLATNFQLKKYHAITTAIEHSSVRVVFEELAKQGLSVTYLPVDREGLVRVEDLRKNIQPNTFLVSVMLANNEIGTIQPVAAIGRWLKNLNQERAQRIFFHTDAAQAAPYLKIAVAELGVDCLTVSAHKLYGPKGVGALYLKEPKQLQGQLAGGGQEAGLRSGTLNVPGIVGLAAALDIIESAAYQKKIVQIKNQRDFLWENLKSLDSRIVLNGSVDKRLPNNLNITFPGRKAEVILIKLDQAGIAVSAGSACAANAWQESKVLAALGLTREQNQSSLRISLGSETTRSELKYVLKIFANILKNAA